MAETDEVFLEKPIIDETEAEKLTDWKNEPKLETLKKDLESCKSYHSTKISDIERWRNQLNVTGPARPKKHVGRSSVQPKVIRRQAEWRYPSLTEPFLNTESIFQVEPATFEDVKAAEQNELVLNWQMRTKINSVKFIDDYVRSAVNDGTVIVRIGWNYEFEEVEEEVPIWAYYALDGTDPSDEEYYEQFELWLQAYNANIRGFEEENPEEVVEAIKYYLETGEVTRAEIIDVELETIEKPIHNHPTLEVLRPENVYIDPTCKGDLDRALFVIVSYEVNKADLLKEKDRYKNIDKIDWTNSRPATDPDHNSSNTSDFVFSDPSRQKSVAYDYWGFYDIHGDGKLVPIVATWIGNTLIRLEENPFPDKKLPFVTASYMPVVGDIYGQADAELLEDNQAIAGSIMRGMIDLLGRSANGQQGIAKGLLDPANRRKYEQGRDYEFNPNLPAATSIIEHKFPEIPMSALNLYGQLNQDSEALTGIKSFSGGINSDAYGRVATGIKSALDAAGKREMSILRRLAKGIQDIGHKIISMNSEFLSETEIVRVTNEHFVEISREDLAGRFDLIIDISTAEVDESKAQDLSFMLQTAGPNMDPKMFMLILSKIAKLKKLPDLAKQLADWEPTPDPLSERRAELELMKLEAEIEYQRSLTQLNIANAQRAMSDAGNKEVDAAKKQMDMYEQGSGIAHQRAMEHAKAQARANQDLQITKALTSSSKLNELPPNIDEAIMFREYTRNDES